MAAYNMQVKRKEHELLQIMEELKSEQNQEIKEFKAKNITSAFTWLTSHLAYLLRLRKTPVS